MTAAQRGRYALRLAHAGERLSSAEAMSLRGIDDRCLDELTAVARSVRARAHGERVTYSANVFLPVTQLCRDVCHYCTFARPPRDNEPVYMSVEEVLEVARRGRDAGSTEALFTLGDKPELRYRLAREELKRLGFRSTAAYLEHVAGLVLVETGLLPHLNPGVLDERGLQRMRTVSASMGLMLESASARLLEPGGPHHGSPDKDPATRLAMIRDAGRQAVPFTTGILIGIGETRKERIDALLRIRALNERYGHIQEVIVQNFRAKPGTIMADHPEPTHGDLLWTIAMARLVLGERTSLQAPPNLCEQTRLGELLDAGIDDWGGVSALTIDHVNPEAPWPTLGQLQLVTADRGLDLLPRLTVYPRYVQEAHRWVDESVRPAVLAASDSLGLARGTRWWPGSEVDPGDSLPSRRPRRRGRDELDARLARTREGEALEQYEVAALLSVRGDAYARVVAAADELRREVCGDGVTYVVNRNINYTNVCYFRCGFCAFSKGKLARNLRGRPYLVPTDEVVRRCEEAWDRGATEVCLQGGIHPSFDGEYYLEIVRAVHAAVPGLHVHAFSPLELWQGAATLGLELVEYLERLRDTGLGSLPGTAAEILSDDVRAVLCPDKLDSSQWREVVETAHSVGLRSTSTIMFGHVDGPESWAHHLLTLREIARASGGITEFVPLPFVHMEAPIALRGRARHGPTLEEAILMHAVGRLVLHPYIPHIQASWVKLGVRGSALALSAGVDDLGGTLMNESISRAAGAVHGQELTPERMQALVRSVGRIPRQRTTLYGDPDPAQVKRSFGAPPLSEPHNPPASEVAGPSRAVLVRRGPRGSVDNRSGRATAPTG
jgi:FO synthase